MPDHEFVWIIRLIKTLSFPLFPSHHRPVPRSVLTSQTARSSSPNNQPFLHSQSEELSNYPNCELCSSQCMIHSLQLWKEQNKTQSFRHSHSRSIISSGEFWKFYWTQEDYRASARLRMRPRAREGAKRALSEDNGSVAASAIHPSAQAPAPQ